MSVATLYRAAQALADEIVIVGAGRCELTADPGDPGRTHDDIDRRRGRCSRPIAAIRWEDGFLDKVCDEHAVAAERRGAYAFRPKRHDGSVGATSAPAQPKPDPDVAATHPPVVAGGRASDRIMRTLDYRMTPDVPALTPEQVSVVLRALADHTAITAALAHRADPGSPWPQATSMGRWLHDVADDLGRDSAREVSL